MTFPRLLPAAAVVVACLLTAPALAQVDKTKATRAERPMTQEEKDAAAAAGASIVGGSLICMAVAIIAGAILYFAPVIIALFRGHPNIAPILVVNVFLGWSLIGWVVAMAWAVSAQEPRTRGRTAARYDDNPFG